MNGQEWAEFCRKEREQAPALREKMLKEAERKETAEQARYQQRLKISADIPDLWLVISHPQDWEECIGFHIDTVHLNHSSAVERCNQINEKLDPYRFEQLEQQNVYEVMRLEPTADELSYTSWDNYDDVHVLGKCLPCLTRKHLWGSKPCPEHPNPKDTK